MTFLIYGHVMTDGGRLWCNQDQTKGVMKRPEGIAVYDLTSVPMKKDDFVHAERRGYVARAKDAEAWLRGKNVLVTPSD